MTTRDDAPGGSGECGEGAGAMRCRKAKGHRDDCWLEPTPEQGGSAITVEGAGGSLTAGLTGAGGGVCLHVVSRGGARSVEVCITIPEAARLATHLHRLAGAQDSGEQVSTQQLLDVVSGEGPLYPQPKTLRAMARELLDARHRLVGAAQPAESADAYTRGVIDTRRMYAQAWADGAGQPVEAVAFTTGFVEAAAQSLCRSEARVAGAPQEQEQGGGWSGDQPDPDCSHSTVSRFVSSDDGTEFWECTDCPQRFTPAQPQEQPFGSVPEWVRDLLVEAGERGRGDEGRPFQLQFRATNGDVANGPAFKQRDTARAHAQEMRDAGFDAWVDVAEDHGPPPRDDDPAWGCERCDGRQPTQGPGRDGVCPYCGERLQDRPGVDRRVAREHDDAHLRRCRMQRIWEAQQGVLAGQEALTDTAELAEYAVEAVDALADHLRGKGSSHG